MTIKWKLRGFDNYFITTEGYVIRGDYVTKHLHFKSIRFISFNSRNQVILYRNGAKEYWSKRQLHRIAYKVKLIKTPDVSSIEDLLPF
jgi:hypothetical protein